MVKDPRSPPPDPSDPDDAVELLRALARRRAAARPAPHEEGEGLESLHAIAERLQSQLRGPVSDEEEADAPLPQPPRRDRRSAGAMRRQWREFVAALPPLAALVPRLPRERMIFIVMSLAVLAIAAAGRVIGTRTAPADHGVAGPSQVVPPTARNAPPLDIPAITRAMAECDQAAARNPDTLAFLSLPVVRAGSQARDWQSGALQVVGNSYLLLSAKEALDGLRDGSLALRPGRYTFSVLDPESGATYSWTSATDMSRLERPNSAALKQIQLGFDFSAAQTGPHWSKPFERKPGSCYWVVVLVLE